MCVTVVKSFTAAHPFAGCARTPDDVHRYVDGREHGPSVGGVPVRPVHFWPLPPLHVPIRTAVPLAVPASAASRHSPDSTATTVPSEFTRHCWFAPPEQDQICTLVPGVVACPGTSRHLLPYTVSWLASVDVHCWLVPPQQSYICRSAPSVWLPPTTSRHRLEATPRRAPLEAACAGVATSIAANAARAATTAASTADVCRRRKLRLCMGTPLFVISNIGRRVERSAS
ncbi:hypothetical protein RKD37_002515 [Streptomyces ambofaciens]